MFTRRVYAQIAEAIKLSKTKTELITLLIVVFKQENPAFNATKFVEAIGEVGEE